MVLRCTCALHRVHLNQISLFTSPTRIELLTTGSRRYKLSRDYPCGIHCDDMHTSSWMEGNVLIVEMPITRLVPMIDGQPVVAERAPVPASKRLKTPSAAAAGEASADPRPPSGGGKPSSLAATYSRALDEARPRVRASPSSKRGRCTPPACKPENVPHIEPRPDAGTRTAVSTATSAARGSDDQRSLFSLIDHAAAQEEGRRDHSGAKMRRIARVEAARMERARTKEQHKKAQKQALLDTAKEIKRAAKNAMPNAAMKTPASNSAKKTKRVTFSV